MATTDTPRESAERPVDVRETGTAADQRYSTDRVVLGVVGVMAIALVVWGAVATDSLGSIVEASLGWVVDGFGWLFVLAATGFVLFSLWLAFSRYGQIPLGRDDEKPEFRTISWIAMMFSAGMGIGLMFYAVVEPLSHFNAPPPGTTGDPASQAMATTLFHWTLHPWAMYAVVGLAIAYSTYRRGRRQLLSSAFAPLLGERRANSGGGKVIDILALFATLFGSAASLGLGALQIGAGLTETGALSSVGTGMLVLVIAILTVAFVASAVSGVAKGIQWLANTNMVLAIALAFFIFVVGPTVLILNLIPTAVGSYIAELPSMSAMTAASGDAATAEWLAGWTIFYWAWWVSWTPFVGMFIARISRARTIRQFVLGVIAVPSLVSLVWFAIFGGSAISEQQAGSDIVGDGALETQLFGLLEQFPLTTVTSILVMVLVAIFFVSGADAASMVMGTLSQRGTQRPTRQVVIFWGVLTGAVAALMLLLGGGEALAGLQQLTILAAFPFILVMVALCVSLAKDLRSDPLIADQESMRRRMAEATADLERARERGRGA
ncbi:BCCT family transporter [soil metagenome]